MIRVAVSIPTYNQAEYLPIAVRSALEQFVVETEVWVSDDASTDSTNEVMKEFAGNPRVHYHRQEKNQGIAANAGWVLSQPKTEFIVRLDSDDILLPNYCRTITDLLQADQSVGVGHAAVEEIDEFGRRQRTRRLARKSGVQNAVDALRASTSGYRVAANICMFRQTALRSLPTIYRPSMNFAEDWDLFARLASKGWGNVYCSNVLSRYRVWSDSAGYREGRKASEIEGIVRLFKETLEPAWKERAWDFDHLASARIKLAKNHARSLLQIPESSSDFQVVRSLLNELAGDGNKFISSHLCTVRKSPSSRSRVAAKCKLYFRDLLKSVLYR